MKRSNHCAIVILLALTLNACLPVAGHAQAQTRTKSDNQGKARKRGSNESAANKKVESSFFHLPSSFSLASQSSDRFFGSQLNKPHADAPRWFDAKIKGDGTPGKIPVFTSGTNIGDSVITQTAGGISVSGIIQTSGGIRFPDGSTQTTAASGGGGGGGGFSLPFIGTVSAAAAAFSVNNTDEGVAILGSSTTGGGVSGLSSSSDGVRGQSSSGNGVFGRSHTGTGVRGISDNEVGVIGSGKTVGVFGISDGDGVSGSSSSGNGIVGQSVFGVGVVGRVSGATPAVFGESGFGGTGVRGIAKDGGIGVVGQGGTGGIGVVGQTAEAPVVTANDRAGVTGASNNNFGVRGVSVNFNGVSGVSFGGNAVSAESTANFAALFATNISGAGPASHAISGVSKTGVGVRGESQTGLAGAFIGNVQVTGNLSKGGGSFKIDHPLDPENKYLSHSFVESPDMMNVYNGNITTDEYGDAVVKLPEYFEALNRDFRYQLTVIGTFAQAIIATEVEGNQFAIKTNGPNVKVSWQVTGIRKDPYAENNRIPVEEAKSEQERGYFLHPKAYGQPDERSVEWAREPEAMRRLRKAIKEAGESIKALPPPGSGAAIAPPGSNRQ